MRNPHALSILERSNMSERDIEKDYPLADFVAKLRRLAEAIENGEQFEIPVAGERIYVPVRARYNIEHEIAKLTWEMLLDPAGDVGTTIELLDAAAKKKSGRRIPLHKDLRSALTHWRKQTAPFGPVVPSERGGICVRSASSCGLGAPIALWV
jgi:integrase